FKRFKKEDDVRKFLETHLAIGLATVDEVVSFLQDASVRDIQTVNDKNILDTADPGFVSMIVIRPTARPDLLIFSNIWVIAFHFKDGILLLINVRKFDVSF